MPLLLSRLIRRGRRSRLASAAKTARNLTFARAALSLVQTQVARRLPGAQPKRTVTPARAAIAGGALAGIAGVIRTRRSGGGGGGGGGGVPAGPVPPPAPANYDAPGPPQNTATPVAVPVVEPLEPAGLDEEAEVAAAAAGAAAIGGLVDPYAPSRQDDLFADEAARPLIEAGEGVSEGQEQTEADLVDNVTDPYGPGAGLPDAEFQIDEVIEQADNPFQGEVVDPKATSGGEESGPAA